MNFLTFCLLCAAAFALSACEPSTTPSNEKGERPPAGVEGPQSEAKVEAAEASNTKNSAAEAPHGAAGDQAHHAQIHAQGAPSTPTNTMASDHESVDVPEDQIVPQPGASIGDATRCPVSKETFIVRSTSASAEHAGQKYCGR